MKSHFTKKEHTDSGLALILLTVFAGLISHEDVFFRMTILEVLLLMIAPVIFYPFTIFWLNLSHLLGIVMSKIILSLIFILLVVPIGLFRRILGKDRLILKKFSKPEPSAFITREYEYSKSDLIAPY